MQNECLTEHKGREDKEIINIAKIITSLYFSPPTVNDLMDSLSQINTSCLIHPHIFCIGCSSLIYAQLTYMRHMTALKSFSRSKLVVLHGTTAWYNLISLSVKLMFSRNLSIIFNKSFPLILFSVAIWKGINRC